MPDTIYYVYIMSNATGSVFYIGVTEDLTKRVYEHKLLQISGISAKYRIDRLLHFETYSSADEAKQREQHMQTWRRSRKISFIEQNNPHWQELHL